MKDDTARAQVLLERDGVLVNEVEIKDATTGSHFKVTITPERVIMRVFKYGSRGKPNIMGRILLPGENRLKSAGGVRLLLKLPDELSFPIQFSFPFAVTNSLKLRIVTAWRYMHGDLLEEYAELKLKGGVIKARMWYWKQILISASFFTIVTIRKSIVPKLRG